MGSQAELLLCVFGKKNRSFEGIWKVQKEWTKKCGLCWGCIKRAIYGIPFLFTLSEGHRTLGWRMWMGPRTSNPHTHPEHPSGLVSKSSLSDRYFLSFSTTHTTHRKIRLWRLWPLSPLVLSAPSPLLFLFLRVQQSGWTADLVTCDWGLDCRQPTPSTHAGSQWQAGRDVVPLTGWYLAICEW